MLWYTQNGQAPFPATASHTFPAAPSLPRAFPGPSRILSEAVRRLWQVGLPLPTRAETWSSVLPLLEGAGPESLALRAAGEGGGSTAADSELPSLTEGTSQAGATPVAGLATKSSGGTPPMMGEQPR